MAGVVPRSWKIKQNRSVTMSHFKMGRAVLTALAVLAIVGSGTVARANIKDYEFQAVDTSLKSGPDRTIAVRLVNKATAKPVPDAVIFATRLDMAPDGMPTMATKVAPLPNTEPGIYRFKATLTMAGGWQLSLGAKVQGETGTVESKLVIRAEQ
jgi:hypothetical protein